MLPPECLNVILDSAAKRAEVKETSDTAVDLKRGHSKELALKKVFNVLTLVLLGQVFSRRDLDL